MSTGAGPGPSSEAAKEVSTARALIGAYAVRIAEEEARRQGVTFNNESGDKRAMQCLAFATQEFAPLLALDLCSAAKHARRKVVTPDDVLFFSRRNDTLQTHLRARLAALQAEEAAEEEGGDIVVVKPKKRVPSAGKRATGAPQGKKAKAAAVGEEGEDEEEEEPMAIDGESTEASSKEEDEEEEEEEGADPEEEKLERDLMARLHGRQGEDDEGEEELPLAARLQLRGVGQARGGVVEVEDEEEDW